MSTAAVIETLAKEFSIEVVHAQRAQELLEAGFKAPYIARYKRAEVGSLPDGSIRRFARRLKQFEELERRRASLLRSVRSGGSSTTPTANPLLPVASPRNRRCAATSRALA